MKTSLVSLVAAPMSASCCVVPVVLLALGFTALGPFGLLMQYRPLTLAISFGLLAASFMWVYRPGAQVACQNGTCSVQSLRRARRIVWFSAVMMMIFVIFSLLPLQVSM